MTANPNITGSEADLILFQVTGSTVSDLGGTIEVFGGEAGLIIANPNGITCVGCGFINVNRVDLVTGSGYDAGTNTFSTIAATDITVEGSALNLSNVDLNIQTGRDFSNDVAINVDNLNITAEADFNNDGSINTDNLNITAGDDFKNAGFINTDNLNIIAGDDFSNSATINTDTVIIEVTNFANDIRNSGIVSSTNLNFILTDSFTTSSTSFSSFNNFSNLAITTDGTFTNTTTIHPTDNTAITANSFINTGGVVNTGTFTLSVAGNFDYANNGTITANAFNFNVGGNFSNNDSNSNFTWGVNDTLTVLGNANIVAAGFENSGTISADALTLSVAGAFDYIADYANGTITTNVFNLNVGGDFTFSESANNFIWRANDTLTVSGTANITAASFNNSGNITVTNDSFNATVDTFINQAGATIAAFGECNIVATTSSDNGTINCLDFAIEAMVIDIAEPNSNGLSDNQVDDFDVNAEGTILNNSAVGGTAQFRSTDVEGNSNITAGREASLILFQITGSTVSDLGGTIEVFGGNAGLIIANPNGIVCTGCAFINANRLDLVTGSNYNADTNTFGSIAAANIDIAGSGLDTAVLKIETGADFNNTGNINTDNLNITAGADFNNAGIINTDNLNITAGDDFSNSATINNTDTVTIEVTNFANDIENTGTISSANLNFILTANFTHSSTSLSGFNFSNLAISTDGTFTNTATINPAGNLTITANTFNNTGGVVNVDTFALSVADDFDYGTITANTSNLQVGGDFSGEYKV